MLAITGEKPMVEAVSDKRIKVGIFGPYGFGNMGDALLAEASIAGIKRYLPNAEFIGICQQPENAKARHGIESLPIYRDYIRPREKSDHLSSNLHQKPSIAPAPNTALLAKVLALVKRIKPLFILLKFIRDSLQKCIKFVQEIPFTFYIYKNLKKLDLVVISGSGLFTEEWGGPWGFPFALFRWSLLARLAGCKLAYMSVGGGIFKSPLTRFLCKYAVSFAHYRGVRDQNTFNHLHAWGVKRLTLVPDMAFSAKLPNSQASSTSPPVVCINPISYCDPRCWSSSDPERYALYTSKLAEFGSTLLTKGYALHFVPNNIDMDNPTIDDIIELIHAKGQSGKRISRTTVKNYEDVYQGIGGCDFVIASRFHGVVFSLMQSKPVIAIAHHYKYSEVLKEMNQGKYCMDINEFQTADLLALFEQLCAEKAQISSTISDQVKRYQQKTEQQFHRVASLVTDNTTSH